jgi:hypothetical protein
MSDRKGPVIVVPGADGKLRQAPPLVGRGLQQAEAGVRSFHAPERTFTKLIGCWNCQHWENGEKAFNAYAQARDLDIRRMLTNALNAKTPLPEAMVTVKQKIANQDRIMCPPLSGLCALGASGPDGQGNTVGASFTLAGADCEKWKGRIKPDGKLEIANDFKAKVGEE